MVACSLRWPACGYLPAVICRRRPGHPQGVALLYTPQPAPRERVAV